MSGKTATIDASTSVLDTERVVLVVVAVVLVALAILVLLWPGRRRRRRVSRGVRSHARELHQRVEHGRRARGAQLRRRMRAGRDRDHVRTRARRGPHVVGRVAHVDRGALVEQRVGLAVGVAPPEHGVDRRAPRGRGTGRAFGSYLAVTTTTRPPASCTAPTASSRAREEIGAGDADARRRARGTVGPAAGVVGVEAVAELEVEVAPEQGVEHVVAGDRGAGLGLERGEGGEDAGPGVDQGHVEVEPDDESAPQLATDELRRRRACGGVLTGVEAAMA